MQRFLQQNKRNLGLAARLPEAKNKGFSLLNELAFPLTQAEKRNDKISKNINLVNRTVCIFINF